MSTYYYDLKTPWSRIEVEQNPEQHVIRLWDSQMLQAGVLTLSSEDGQEAIFNFFREEAAYQTYFGEGGTVLIELRRPRTRTLLSEYGEVVTHEELERKCCRRGNESTKSVLEGRYEGRYERR